MIRHRMYINGRLDRAVDNANLGLYNYSQYGYLGLGNTSESYLDGLLDEVMVFNQSLTDMQANELSNAQAVLATSIGDLEVMLIIQHIHTNKRRRKSKIEFLLFKELFYRACLTLYFYPYQYCVEIGV